MTPRTLDISEVHIRWAPDRDRAAGLLAYVAVTLGGSVRLDGITLRRARDGSSYLAFPHRVDTRGRERWYARPLTEAAKREFEDAVRSELTRQGEPPATKQGEPGELAGAESARLPRRGSAR